MAFVRTVKVRKGDMIITARGQVGLLVAFTPAVRAAVQFVNNGPRRYFDPTSLRRASLAEIEASPLNGVGCNQATEPRLGGRHV